LKPIASRQLKRDRPSNEAGFTLTELVAGLLVASALVIGLAEITRRYVSTTVRVKDIAADIRAIRLLDSLMAELERVDPGTLELTADRVSARVGSKEITATLGLPQNGARALQWSSPSTTRTLSLPAAARFQRTPDGAIALLGLPEEPPLAVSYPMRTTPFDCQFDTVIRDCR
jgi:hypothetical protein